MQLLTTNNLNGEHNKYKELLSIVRNYKPTVVTLVGDLLLTNLSSPYLQNQFIPDFHNYISEMSKYSKIIFIPGDNDIKIFEPELNEICNDYSIFNVHNGTVEIDGYSFLGVPYVRDYNTQLKDWVRIDDPYVENSDPSIIPYIVTESDIQQLNDFHTYLTINQSIEDYVLNRLKNIKDIQKSIWLFHNPPSFYDLDIIENKNNIGSGTCKKLMEGYYTNNEQPLLICSGHVVNNIIYTNKWFGQYKNCTCIQPSQSNITLYFGLVSITGNTIDRKFHPLQRSLI